MSACIRLLLLLGLTLIPTVPVSGQASAKKVALLVGVNMYLKRNFKNLDYSERDVTELDKELKALGFRTVLLLGSADGDLKATRENIDKQLRKLLVGIGKNDIVLVALSGHGQQLTVKGPDGAEKEDGFYCPYDAEVGSPSSLFSLSYLTDDVLANQGGRNIVLVDACRDVPKDAGRGARGVQGKIVSLPEDTALFFSCKAGQQSWENDELRHGVFTYCLLEGLRGEAVKGNSIAWTNLVAHVDERMASDAMKKYLPKPQEPISAGGVGRMVLGSVESVKAVPLVAPFSAAEAKAGQGAWAKSLGKPVVEKNGIGMEMVLIPPGEFLMGSSDDDVTAAVNAPSAFKHERKYFEAEQPPHRVRITKPFRMGMHEVTQGEYAQVMGDNPSYFSRTGGGKSNLGGLDPARFPVEQVSWYDAVDFCNKLSSREGLKPFYTIANLQRKDGSISSADVTVVGGHGYRLPTEAEWEYACRAGTTTAFHFGDVNNGKDANFNGNYPFGTATKGTYLERTTTVGSFTANRFGLRDVCGNVWEWCGDWFDKETYGRANGTAIDPTGPSFGRSRVLRGGSWNHDAWNARSASRNAFTPGFLRSWDRVGFRVSMTP